MIAMTTEHTDELIEELKSLYTDDEEQLKTKLQALKYQKHLNYWDYINLDVLLNLQQPRSEQPDEMVFIGYHQITELYFKLTLWELHQLSEGASPSIEQWQTHLGRIINYFRVLTQSFSIMREGIDGDQFMKFRPTLAPASGFQSVQYRMIELACTPLINLVQREAYHTVKDATIEDQFEAIYWKQGAIDKETGEKTLTLRHFEDKYEDFLLDYVRRWQGHTLWERYQSLPAAVQQDREVIRQMRFVDKFVNVSWPKAHYGTAKQYLEHSNTKGTGGTNYHEYLPPAVQKRIFFPDLWSEEEIERWGENYERSEDQSA